MKFLVMKFFKQTKKILRYVKFYDFTELGLLSVVLFKRKIKPPTHNFTALIAHNQLLRS